MDDLERVTRFVRASGRRRSAAAACAVIALLLWPRHVWASDCPGRTDVIATDRPDTTNSSVVVPFGSLQVENGANWSIRQESQIFDASETRARLGVAPCTEVLVDVPNYFVALNGLHASQMSNLTISVKRQLFAERPSFSLSAAAGFGIPVGRSGDSAPFYTPYIQFPWSLDIAEDWSVNGMFTVTWLLNHTDHATIVEPTLTLEREFGSTGDLFVEYIGDYAARDRASNIVDVGGAWHVTRRQQLDFHLGFGLSHVAPDRYVGVGYSIRVDGLFGRSSLPAARGLPSDGAASRR
jgi:outer membrane putative beta-barrel porin/alpha-amylase